MKTILMAAGASLLLGGCSTMMGEDMAMDGRTMAGTMAMPTDAATYMKMAHSSDMFEIESSRLALQMSRDERIRSFAQMMVDDHTRLMNEMMAVAPGMGMSMGGMEMMPHHMQMLQRLRGASAAEFDMMYKREQMMAHQEALMLHRTYAARGDNDALRGMAARAAPVIQAHLARSRGLPAGM